MTDTQFKVLLYADGSHQSFSAAVYTAMLLQNMPSMNLTVLHIRDSEADFWEKKYGWIDTWPINPTPEWVKHVISDSDGEMQKEYNAIISKTNEIFCNKKYNVRYQELFSNVKLSEISHTADLIIEYAAHNVFDLIVIGTRGYSSLEGLIYGSLAHTVLTRSLISVMLVKKLPQEFIDDYLSGSSQNCLRRIK